MEEMGDRERTGLVVGRKGRERWYLMPAVLAAFSILPIILLLWVDRISERLRNDSDIEDAIMDMQIHTATFHLWLEEALTGNVAVTIKDAFASLDQAMNLVDVTLAGGESEHKRISKPLVEPDLRVRAEEIKSLLIKVRILGLERQQKSDKSGSGSVLEHQFHAVFMEVLGRARALEDIIERNEAKNLADFRRFLLGILIMWVSSMVVALAAIWSRELRRRRAVAALVEANDQLLSQAEELSGHREHLTELVEKRTQALTDVNKRLQLEIVEHTHAEELLRETEKHIRYLSTRLLNAQEIERRRISMELHDALGQALNGVKLQIRIIEKGLLETQKEIKKDCEKLLEYMDQVIEDVRRLSLDLSPTILEDLGLTSALRWLISTFANNPSIRVKADIAEIDLLLPDDQWITIYRVIQEALSNIAKHSQAENVSVVIQLHDEKVLFLVEDDGNGFDLVKVSKKDDHEKHLGLTTMNERVRMIGGNFDLWSLEGKGTRITFSIPIER